MHVLLASETSPFSNLSSLWIAIISSYYYYMTKKVKMTLLWSSKTSNAYLKSLGHENVIFGPLLTIFGPCLIDQEVRLEPRLKHSKYIFKMLHTLKMFSQFFFFNYSRLVWNCLVMV